MAAPYGGRRGVDLTRRRKTELRVELVSDVPCTSDDESVFRRGEKCRVVSGFFTNWGRMMKPIQRVNVDFTASMLEELESAAKELNISRQAVIKTLVRQGLDQRQRARATRHRARRS